MRSALCYVTCLLIICLLQSWTFALHDEPGGPKDIGNSAPPGIGGNGPFQSLNMDLLGHLTLNQIGGGQGNVLGNDCWGWTDPSTGKEYAIAGLTNATSFIDISNPTDPKYLGKLLTQTGNSTWRDMKVYSNHVFIVSDNNSSHGMQVFDLTQLRNADPNNPQNFSNTALYTGINSAHNIAINEDSGFAYIVGSGQASGGLHVVDISNPSNPVFAGDFSGDGYTHDAQIVTYNGPDAQYAGREIAFASNTDTLTIVDVTDKSNMVQISRNGYADDGYTHQSWLSEDQRYVYLCDELDENNVGGPTRTHIWDCQDLDNPIYQGFHLGSSNAIDHNLYIKGDYMYLASYSAGLRILEIDQNDPTQLTEIAFFDTYVTDNDTDFDGAWSCYPFYESGVIFVNDRQNGLFVVRMSGIQLDFPNGMPNLIDPSGGTSFQVEVTGFMSQPEPDTGVLHVDRGSGFEEFPMTETSPNNYDAIFPTTQCGEEVRYFVSAMDQEGNTVTNPPNAPLVAFTVMSGDSIEETFGDDFEVDLGWSVAGDATDGQWERGVPAGGNDRGDPPSDADGSGSCYLTDNVSGNSDVDGGSTILTSPLMDAIGSGNGVAATISYYRWYSNSVGNAPASDIFTVEISNDDGESWVELETVGPGGSEVSGGWFQKTFRISDFVTPSSEMRLRFTASDLGDGSVVEAAVDGIKIEIIECQSTVTAVPESFTFATGETTGGGLSDLATSDNNHVLGRKESAQISGGVNIEFKSTSQTETPSELELTFEASVLSRRVVTQTLELYNYDTASYEIVDTRNSSRTGDLVVTASPGGDLSRFVEPGTRCIEARVRFLGSSNRQTYVTKVDQVLWTITD